MSNRTLFRTLTTLVPAGPSLAEALVYYENQLGFTRVWASANSAGVRRGDVELILVENDNPQWAENSSVGFGVDDLSALFEEYKSIDARVGPLERKSWGRVEFHMIIPSGVCFQFHQVETRAEG